MKHLILFLVIYCGSTQAVTDKEYALLPPVFELDNYDRCMLLRDEALYCTIEFHMRPIDPDNPTDIWTTMKEVSDNPKNYRHDNLRHGICVPFTCPDINRTKINDEFKEELAKCYNKKYVAMGIEGTIAKMSCQTSESEPTDWLDNITLYGLIAYFLFVVYASFYEGTARYYSKTEYDKKINTPVGTFLAAFSVPKNWYRLKSIKDTPDVRALRGIQGVRFYNMICVILAHSAMSAMVGPVENTKYPETVTDKVSNMFMSSGSYAVQTFFMISSWLLTYQMLVAFENKKEIKPGALVWVFINRYIRLTPPMALMILLHSTWLRHMGNGPFWDHIVGEEYRNCRANGWTNILYINNYVNAQNMCMSHSWYLAADTQLFILALIVIASLKKYPNYAKLILGVPFIIGVALPGLIAYFREYDILFRTYPEIMYYNTLREEIWRVMTASAFTNGGSYFLGIIVGYIYYHNRDKKMFISKASQAVWWMLSFGLPLSMIFLAYPLYQDGFEYTMLESALYWSFGRNVFVLGIALLLYGYTKEVGWFALWVCRWSGVQHLGRLTYSAYLVHVFFMRSRSVYIRTPVYANDFVFFSAILGDVALSYIAALFLSLFLELPITALQKMLIPQAKKEEKTKPMEVLTSENSLTKS